MEGQLFNYVVYHLERSAVPARVDIEEGATSKSTPVSGYGRIL